ncbi:copper amine oxidase N-terminal domain-containing protein [Paenibacillus sp. H1-7]|uniref:copper amine oxidase N-terminal domain-containing protein n=1 Tax=Paenibacillus sp. H1-7 TaxID=2282849 RepID=UPI001EF85ECA|nr:copper amine oxidase N-terminal domain-containing protein [Paenibacillus sp. H1-7]
MKNITMQRWLSLLLIVMLVVLAGCQPVNGVDLNKLIESSSSVKTSQGTQTITFDLIRNASVKPSEEQQKMLDLFGNVKLSITDMKQQDLTHLSVKGTFEYAKGKIPFQIVMSDQQYIIQVEGAKKPIVLHNSGGASMEQLQSTLSKEMQEQLKQLQKKAEQMAPTFVTYFGTKLPNPKTVSITDSKQTINNESLNLKQVHVEVKGDELLGLVKGFLTNLLADEKGMKELIGQLYDLVLPLAQQAMKESKAQNQENPMDEMIAPYLNNKTLAVEFAYTFLQTNLKKTLDNYDQSVQEALSSPAGSSLRELLSEKNYLKLDLYVDSDLIPRKSYMELLVNFPTTGEESVTGMKVTSTSEVWNINKPVTADTIDVSGGKLELESLNKPGKVLQALDSKSKLYELLKSDLHITKKEINMFMDDSEDIYADSVKPYNRNGVVMVPARFVVEQLDADVTWDAATQQVSIVDSINGTVIKLNIGSKQASVNGMIKPLEAEAELTNGSTFVPVRFIAENMGAVVSWDQELQMVTITRD